LKLLLDTHIWLWSLLEPDRLSENGRQTLRRAETELYLSPISIWELTILASKGRVVLTCEVEEWVDESLSRVPITEIPLTIQAALEANRLKLPHHDPADRFIVATAKTFELTLATADTRILNARLCALLPNA